MLDHTQKLRILAFEPFDSGSHCAIRESITQHSHHQWTWLTQPGRNWKWRMRTAALEMIEDGKKKGLLISEDGESVGGCGGFELIFTTSLLSAADLRANLPRGLWDLPLILSMHENQVAYPYRYSEGEENGGGSECVGGRDSHFALTNLTSLLTADLVIWNSNWNQDSFLLGIQDILKHHPDNKLGNCNETIKAKSTIIWPPTQIPELDSCVYSAAGSDESVGGGGGGILHNSVRVVWPHRWEHDKGPGELLEIADRYTEQYNLRWILLGEQFQTIPTEMQQFIERWSARIDHYGYVKDRAEYNHWLTQADWVLSTAQHEFFGIAVVEALLVGCLPWLPNRLSYPELLPESARGLSPMHPPDDPDAVKQAIREHLQPALAHHSVAKLDTILSTVK